VNRERLYSLLWTAEIVAGVLPAAGVLVVSLVPYVITLPAMPSMILNGFWRSAVVLNGTMLGGISGIIAILMASRPDRLHDRPKLKRVAIVLGCAGICAEILYLIDGGLRDVASHFWAAWVALGPIVVGIHCAVRVFVSPVGPGKKPSTHELSSP
jgi:hypothetical protein